MLVTVIALAVGVPLGILSSIFDGAGRINFSNYSEALAKRPVDVVINAAGTITLAYIVMRY